MKRPLRQEHIFPIALLAALCVHGLLYLGLPDMIDPPHMGQRVPLRVGLKHLAPNREPGQSQPEPRSATVEKSEPHDPAEARRAAVKPTAPPRTHAHTPAKRAQPPRSDQALPDKQTVAPPTSDAKVSQHAPLPATLPPADTASKTKPTRATSAPSAPLPSGTSTKETAALETQLPPSLLQHPEPFYPPLAKRMGWQGRVLLRLDIGADGRVNDVRLEQSSGYPLLDRSARKQVRRWRFAPAKRNGVPVKGEVLLPVVFELRKG